MDNICQENCYDYGEFGILLYYEGCVEEARFIFDRIVHTMAEHSVPLVTLDGDDLMGTEFVDLVSCFHNEGTVHDETFNKLLELSRNVSALELRHLVEHLGKSMKRLDCIALVRKLGQQILEREFAQFTSEDFLRIVWVLYELKERELLTSIWEKVCSERIEEQCLFGRILLETWPDFAKRDEALKTVCYASNASNQALDSSLEIVRRKPDIITDCWIYSVCLLNDALSDETRTKTILTEILPSYNNSRLSDIAWYIFTSTSGVLNQHSAIRQVFENALERISTTDLDLCSLFKTFRMLAWFGDLELLRNRYEELVNERNSTLVHLILSSFKNKHRRAASELGFSRDVFNLMLVKCVDNVEALQYGRANYFTRCCRLFAEAERNFIDSSEKNVAPAFSRLVQRLSSLEAAKVLKVLCVREVNNSDEPSLKKFPPCWQVFKELSAKAVEHLRTFELNRFPTRDVVSLMHCFFYVGEQEPLDKFQRLVCEMCKVEASNADRAIIKHRNTLPLALAYPPGIFALNELIDARIQRLSVLHSKQSIALVYYRKEMSRLQSLRRTIVLRLTRSRAN